MPLQTQSRPTFRYLLRRIKRQELSASAVLLHYDSQASDLKPWLWPVVGKQRLPPSDFERYGLTHEFRNPCCLCAASAVGIAYTESIVCLDLDGPHSGEYVARCATDSCMYFVPLERMYARMGLHVQRYSARSPLHVPRFFPGPTVTGNTAITLDAHNALLQLLKLDSTGVPEAQFRNLFRKCRTCGTIVTRRARKYHDCTRTKPPVVIDLTLDDDETSIIDLTLDG